MPQSCVAWGCTNRRTVQSKSRGITFHRFPKDKHLRRQWEVVLGREGFSASVSSVLCSEHFKPEDLDRTGQTVRIRDGAKPSVFSFQTRAQRQVAPRTTQTSRRAAESLPVNCPQHVQKTEPPPSNTDHSYALPASPTALKARLSEALARVESLQREIRNVKDRERRAKSTVHDLLEDLMGKNLMNEDLKERLNFFCSKMDVPEGQQTEYDASNTGFNSQQTDEQINCIP